MKTIIVAPYSKPRIDGKPNAKNYPWWAEVVRVMRDDGFVLKQIVYGDETPIEGMEHVFGKSLPEIENIVRESDGFMCVDNYMQHMAHCLGKCGVVIFGPSDPRIFGYDENMNVLPEKPKLRPMQFQTWQEWDFDESAFEMPEVVAAKAIEFFSKAKSPSNNDVVFGYVKTVVDKEPLRFTLAMSQHEDAVRVGIAICSGKDAFVKRVGREIATRRAAVSPHMLVYGAEWSTVYDQLRLKLAIKTAVMKNSKKIRHMFRDAKRQGPLCTCTCAIGDDGIALDIIWDQNK